jgi:hypothetical protein
MAFLGSRYDFLWKLACFLRAYIMSSTYIGRREWVTTDVVTTPSHNSKKSHLQDTTSNSHELNKTRITWTCIFCLFACFHWNFFSIFFPPWLNGVHLGSRVARWFMHFQTKNPTLGKFWRALECKMLVYFMPIWNILRPVGIVYVHLVI